ncbi:MULTISPECIES: EF-hand domain-containing protein [unclassified Lysobacter]|uniref:EF-hand domain-containing protein n=1 Tax=unclassified Lysobacter TaxID=2635362 RepID=UPI001BE59C7F|nr:MULTISPECIES: EF-hand domain-containing protein [unclassified Lysobacter]MBT2745601.1 EF-hand domain-containing protein [Lysobacter sp. ISL-42]MBT2753540.1 EF-hand domain-containing protein [Lysobacter sp. ISL-50]MBT2777076.1 EF-hand domain-containing protein [Lysobacter sp. ISL-54]MBT2780298.1 EF-hand domain-containing protein [Lysobacter sp. ISL-52]
MNFKHKSRKPMILAMALAATLSAPLAFAQSAGEQAPPSSDAATAASAAQDTGAATAAQPAAAPQKKSWSDVDGDKDGNLSKTEAAAVPALGQVFDQADSDANGSLTPDEYKNYVAKVQSNGGGKKGG